MLRNLLSSPEIGLGCIKKLNRGLVFLKILRFNSVISGVKLVYCKYGKPTEVVQKEDMCVEPPGKGHLLIKMLAAPINPSDMNIIQGVYPIKPTLPAVPGNEGVGEVVELGGEVEGFKTGDKVIPKINGFGTWRTHAVCKKEDVTKVDDKLDVVQAATLTINPPTAFRMLKDFVELQPNDTVFQNGANSAVGQCVIQLCKQWNYKSINLVRNRKDIQQLKTHLKDLGATCVFTEEELKTTDVFRSGALPKPKLALNCIGGSIAKDMLRHLADGATVVTYGGMSREPLSLPASALIFSNIQFRGFWITKWNKEHADTPEQTSMMQSIIDMSIKRQLKPPVHKMVTLDCYKDVLESILDRTGYLGAKYIFDFQEDS